MTAVTASLSEVSRDAKVYLTPRIQTKQAVPGEYASCVKVSNHKSGVEDQQQTPSPLRGVEDQQQTPSPLMSIHRTSFQPLPKSLSAKTKAEENKHLAYNPGQQPLPLLAVSPEKRVILHPVSERLVGVNPDEQFPSAETKTNEDRALLSRSQEAEQDALLDTILQQVHRCELDGDEEDGLLSMPGSGRAEDMKHQVQQLSELFKHVSRSMATLTQRVDTMQENIKTFVPEAYLEMKVGDSTEHCMQLMEDRITAAIRYETSLREEMSSFWDSLQMERVNRANDISKLDRSFEEAMEMERVNRMNDISKLHHSFQAALSSGGSTQTPTGSGGNSGSRSPVNSEGTGQIPDVVGANLKSAADLSELLTRHAEESASIGENSGSRSPVNSEGSGQIPDVDGAELKCALEMFIRHVKESARRVQDVAGADLKSAADLSEAENACSGGNSGSQSPINSEGPGQMPDDVGVELKSALELFIQHVKLSARRVPDVAAEVNDLQTKIADEDAGNVPEFDGSNPKLDADMSDLQTWLINFTTRLRTVRHPNQDGKIVLDEHAIQ